jgi:hypothetical protein
VKQQWHHKIEEFEEKPVPVLQCPPQIPNGLTRVQNRSAAVKGRRPTAPRPLFIYIMWVQKFNSYLTENLVRVHSNLVPFYYWMYTLFQKKTTGSVWFSARLRVGISCTTACARACINIIHIYIYHTYCITKHNSHNHPQLRQMKLYSKMYSQLITIHAIYKWLRIWMVSLDGVTQNTAELRIFSTSTMPFALTLK